MCDRVGGGPGDTVVGMTRPPEMWRPRSEAEMQAVIAAGGLEETHTFEIKQDVPATKAGAKELARDLAQFGIDGGILLIGVAEPKDASSQWEPAPVPLPGLSERIEQVARSTIDPPLQIRVSQFASGGDPATGYLVVEVPVSPQAPHMVDGVYYGRGDKTRHRLSDAEVLRLHAARRGAEEEINRLLDTEIERDPFGSQGQRGHLFLAAHPQLARPDLAQALLEEDVRRLLQFNGELTVSPQLRQRMPTPTSASYTPRRAQGVALCSNGLEDGRQATAEAVQHEEGSLDVELREDGGVRVFVGRLTDDHNGNKLILDGLAIAYVTRLLEWTRSVSYMTGYRGRWLLGIAGTRLRGGRSGTSASSFDDPGPVYDVDAYRQITTADYGELDERPGDVVQRLVGRLLRGLGTADYYADHVRYPTTARASQRSPRPVGS